MDSITDKLFGGWQRLTNLDSRYNGRIVLVWRPEFYIVYPINISSQTITCEVVYTPLQLEFLLSVVYAFNTKDERRDLWNNLVRISSGCSKPWLVLGDFNSVLHLEDRI